MVDVETAEDVVMSISLNGVVESFVQCRKLNDSLRNVIDTIK